MLKFLRLAALALTLATPAWAQAPAPRAPATAPAPAATAPAAAPSRARAAPKLAPGQKVDINSASADQLDAIPQIGPARAKAIIAGRPYDDLSDLVKKKVLSQGIFDKAKPGMAIANINTSTATDLAKTLPGIGDVRAAAIVAGRPYATPQDLVTKKVLTDAAFDKIKDLVAW